MVARGKYFMCLVWVIILSGFSETYPQEHLSGIFSKEVALLPGKDSVFLNPVYFTNSVDDQMYYVCILKTPVCNDTLCQMVQIKIFWDLIGDYIRYDTLPGYPLTKNDHLPFTVVDYNKLQTTLKDGNSILGRKSENELLDHNRKRYSEKIDAVTGATDLQVKNAVVDGALYTTYTLWHLVNGEIRQELSDCTRKNYNSAIEQQLLSSGNTNSIIFALKRLNDKDYVDRFQEIIQIMEKGQPLVNFYIAKNLPPDVFLPDENIKSLEMIWQELDPNTKSVLKIYLSYE
jgi:hypothetical protein